MARKTKHAVAKMFTLTLPLFIINDIVLCDDTTPIPPNKPQLSTWFQNNVGPLYARKNVLDPALVAAEGGARIIRVSQDGKGNFKTITEAVNSIPSGNSKRVIIYIAGGNYTEKIKVDRSKPFVTFYGDPNNKPWLVYGGTAAQYGTVDSATLIVESNYFVSANIIVANSAPRPDGKRKGAQAAAFRISGDKAAVYNTRIYGFQDTLCDDVGRHFFKDSYIEGTVDFIFGDGRSLYVNTKLHVVPGDPVAMITAQAGKGGSDPGAYSFAHCKVTGTGGVAFLGRAWMAYAKVVFAYTDMTDVVQPQGWSDNNDRTKDSTVYFGEYQCMGSGANLNGRAGFTKKLSDGEAKPFLNLGFIQASSWLLPPPRL